MKSDHISPKLVNIISLAPGGLGLECGITQGKFFVPHNPGEDYMPTIGKFEGPVINYKVILSLNMRSQIMANHPLSPGLSSLL